MCSRYNILVAAVAALTVIGLTSQAQARGCWHDGGGWWCSSGCAITHCYPIGYGGQRCHWACRAPQYTPRPYVYAPSYPTHGPDPEDMLKVLVALLAVGGVVAAVIAGISGASSGTADPFSEEKKRVETEMAATREQIRKLEAASAEADRHLAAFRKDGGSFGDPHG